MHQWEKSLDRMPRSSTVYMFFFVGGGVFFFFFTQSLLYCRDSNTHKILVFSVSRVWEMMVGQQYFSLGFPTCQNKRASGKAGNRNPE